MADPEIRAGQSYRLDTEGTRKRLRGVERSIHEYDLERMRRAAQPRNRFAPSNVDKAIESSPILSLLVRILTLGQEGSAKQRAPAGRRSTRQARSRKGGIEPEISAGAVGDAQQKIMRALREVIIQETMDSEAERHREMERRRKTAPKEREA